MYNGKKRKISTYIILLILVAVTITALAVKPDALLTQLQTIIPTKKQEAVSQPEHTAPKADFGLEAESNNGESDNPEAESSADSANASDNTVTAEGLTFTFHEVEVTKKIGAHQKSKMLIWNESTDEAGNLTSDDTYVFIRITIKNESDSVREELVNGVKLRPLVDGEFTLGGIEMRYFEQGLDPDAREFFYYTFQPHEEATFDLGYIVEDEALEQYEFCFVINMRGVNPPDETCKIIPVKLK